MVIKSIEFWRRDFDQSVSVSHSLPVGADAYEYFTLLILETLIKEIAVQTNLYAQRQQDAAKKNDQVWMPVTADNIKLFLAAIIMMGIHSLPSLKNYWSQDDRLNVPGVSKLLSQT